MDYGKKHSIQPHKPTIPSKSFPCSSHLNFSCFPLLCYARFKRELLPLPHYKLLLFVALFKLRQSRFLTARPSAAVLADEGA